jgi:hypothetical protein
MRGSVVRRGDGYTVVVELDRDPVTNKRRQKWHSGYRTKRDAERALSEIVASLHTGSYLEPTKQTLSDFTREWLAAFKADNSTVNALQLQPEPAATCVAAARFRAAATHRRRHAQHALRLTAGRGTQELRRGRVVASQRALHPHDRAQGTQGCCEVGTAGPEPCRGCRSTESGRPSRVDHLDCRPAAQLP